MLPCYEPFSLNQLIDQFTDAHGQVQALAGKSFVVGKSPVMGHGANNMLVLNPLESAGGAAAKGAAATGTIWAGTRS